MTLNHNKSIKTVVLLLCMPKKEMHSRDTTVLGDIMSYTTPACFSTFFDLLWSIL